MDYRGYGSMQHVAGDYTIDEIATDALALADALGFQTFSLIGHSMGGMVIEKIAVRVPERVRALVPVAPVPCGGMVFDAEKRALFAGAAASRAQREVIIDRSTGSRLPWSWVQWKADYSMARAAPAAFAAYLDAWADTDFSDDIGGSPPMLVLIGAHDPVFNLALMRATYLRRYPRATIEVLHNAGHYPMNETPLALVALIEDFLRRVDPAA